MTQAESKTWYVCINMGCIWYDKVAEMRLDYQYPLNQTFFFQTEEECCDFINANPND